MRNRALVAAGGLVVAGGLYLWIAVRAHPTPAASPAASPGAAIGSHAGPTEAHAAATGPATANASRPALAEDAGTSPAGGSFETRKATAFEHVPGDLTNRLVQCVSTPPTAEHPPRPHPLILHFAWTANDSAPDTQVFLVDDVRIDPADPPGPDVVRCLGKLAGIRLEIPGSTDELPAKELVERISIVMP